MVFPPEFPFKPPSIYMNTPNGRFKTHTRLCLSISDYHPDTWNPAWSVATILTGLLSFMLEKSPTLGKYLVLLAKTQKKVHFGRTMHCLFASKTKINVFLKIFLHFRSTTGTLHSKIFKTLLILAFMANKQCIVLPKWTFFRVLAHCALHI